MGEKPVKIFLTCLLAVFLFGCLEPWQGTGAGDFNYTANISANNTNRIRFYCNHSDVQSWNVVGADNQSSTLGIFTIFDNESNSTHSNYSMFINGTAIGTRQVYVSTSFNGTRLGPLTNSSNLTFLYNVTGKTNSSVWMWYNCSHVVSNTTTTLTGFVLVKQ